MPTKRGMSRVNFSGTAEPQIAQMNADRGDYTNKGVQLSAAFAVLTFNFIAFWVDF
jgi:hypothetical protein